MRRRLLVGAALCLAGALPSLGLAVHKPAHRHGVVPSGLQLTEAGGAKFPKRAFVLSLPTTRTLAADQIEVTEDGNSVAGVTLTPASATGKTAFGTVLIVDSSDSMAGRPIGAAMAAARAFEAHRNKNQSIALVAFNNAVSVVLPFTRSAAKIDAALSTTPHVAYGTHMYDALAQAVSLLQSARIESGSIVLLSDGQELGSTTTAAAVKTAARQAHVKLFTVGFEDRFFNEPILTSLSTDTGGAYTPAKSTDTLVPIFDRIGTRIANEYLLQYKSLAGPKQAVNVAVSVPGAGTARSAYQTPALPVKIAPPYSPSLKSRFWGSWISTVILALLGAVVAALLVIGVLQPKRSGLPLRMSEFVSVPGLQSRQRRPGGAAEVLAEASAAEEPSGVFARLDSALEIAQIKATGAQLVLFTIAGTAVLFLLIDVVTGTAWWALLAFVVPLGVRWWVLDWKLKRRRKAFAEQLPDMLQIVAGALRSGQSFAGALAVVVENAAEPMKSEMQRVVAAEQLGVPLDIAMSVVVKRMASRDLEQVALVAELQRAAGGNAAEVIDRVAETVRERFDLRRLIDNLTVQGRMSRWIVSGLPVALVGFISIINPNYLHPLTAHLAGKIMLVFAALLVVAGSYAIKKIVDIEV